MSLPVESINFGDMIRDLLLALVASQNEANKNFIADIEELASKDLAINYTRTVNGKNEQREIKGNALSFGITPTLLSIQNAVIELRTALSITKDTTSSTNKTTSSRAADYLFKTSAVDAKYQNTYSYKAEASSVIRITVVPVPPSAALLDAINSVTKAKPLTDNKTL